MANFSAGSGYMPMMSLFGAIASLPATFFVWTGMALSVKTEDGILDYPILKRRLNRVVLPICLMLFALLAWICVGNVYGDILAYLPASLWGALFPSLGIYLSLYYSAKIIKRSSYLTKSRWLSAAMAFITVIAVVGWFVLLLVFEPLGNALNK